MDLAAIPWVQGSLVSIALALIFGGVGMVFKGMLIPRRNHAELVAILEKRITEKTEEAREYKAAWLAAEAARHEQDNQFAELMEFGRTTDAFIRSLAFAAGQPDEGPRHVEA
ncbi:hypothetical protein [Microbispora sp. KK1-11]|uniref:hypothetical protein n=1 Tax=Microbispora sp. KK1-11 TaxID=2053005 RepID=UPI00115BC398|nr:hypothetical protein [Microbispora sp. KK1-11]TQS30067.1 hypothetical protein FLW16_06815 [Microbispora sp. KK1-11]